MFGSHALGRGPRATFLGSVLGARLRRWENQRMLSSLTVQTICRMPWAQSSRVCSLNGRIHYNYRCVKFAVSSSLYPQRLSKRLRILYRTFKVLYKCCIIIIIMKHLLRYIVVTFSRSTDLLLQYVKIRMHDRLKPCLQVQSTGLIREFSVRTVRRPHGRSNGKT